MVSFEGTRISNWSPSSFPSLFQVGQNADDEALNQERRQTHPGPRRIAGGRCIVDVPRQQGTTGSASRNRKVPEGLWSSPSGGPKGSNQLPRDKISLSFPLHPRLAPAGFRHGFVTARAVAVCFHRGRQIIASVGSWNARSCCVAGRRPNVNVGSGARWRTDRNTPRPNASAVVANGRRRRQAWA